MRSITFFILALIIFCIASALNGCAEARVIKKSVAEHGASAADEALETAVWTICNGTSIGAVSRYFNTPKKAQVWRDLCPQASDFDMSETGEQAQ